MFTRRFALSVISTVAVALTSACTTAEAATWRFDLWSQHGRGYFEIDATNFVIPTTTVQSFNVTGADLDILAGLYGVGEVEYTAANFVQGSCNPGGCRAIFGIQNLQTAVAKYDLYLQLDFERIWVSWLTQDQKIIQMWQHTTPYLNTIAWNDAGSAQRTVLDDPIAPVPLPAALPLFVSGLGVMGLLAWRRKRKAAALQAAAC